MARRVSVSSRGERPDKRMRFADHDACVLSVEIENGRRLFYRASLYSSALERIDEGEAGELVVTAYRDDWRAATGGRSLSSKAGASLIARETDVLDPLTVISGRKGYVYATRKARVMEYSWDQTPLTALLDTMVSAPDRPLIAGVVFGDLELVVLYLYGANGMVTERELQVSINPNSLDAAVASFAATHHLPPNVETHLFGQEEFGRALRLQPTLYYPKYATLLGLPYHQAIGIMAGITWLAAISLGGWAGFEQWRIQGQEKEIAAVAAQSAEASSKAGEELRRRLTALAKLTSVDYSKGFEAAQALWPQGGQVAAKFTTSEHAFHVLIPLRMQREKENSALEVGSLERTAQALAAPIPEGCGQSGASITGGMNDIKKSITCPRAVSGSAHGW